MTTVSSGMQARVRLEYEREDDGRWIAEAIDLPGVLAYGPSAREAGRAAMALALRVLADRIDGQGDIPPRMLLEPTL